MAIKCVMNQAGIFRLTEVCRKQTLSSEKHVHSPVAKCFTFGLIPLIYWLFFLNSR